MAYIEKSVLPASYVISSTMSPYKTFHVNTCWLSPTLLSRQCSFTKFTSHNTRELAWKSLELNKRVALLPVTLQVSIGSCKCFLKTLTLGQPKESKHYSLNSALARQKYWVHWLSNNQCDHFGNTLLVRHWN